MGKSIEIRIPFVPGCNDSEMQGIAEIIAGLKNVKRVKLLPYHSYSRSRYNALGMEDTLPELTPDAKCISAARLIFKKRLPSLEII